MRTALTSILVLIILASGILPAIGPHPVAAKDRMACCQKPTNGTGCERTAKPMPCCEIRPAPTPTADVPPDAPRAATPAKTHLHLSAQVLFHAGPQPAGFLVSSPNLLVLFFDPPLYRLHSAYLI